MYEAYFGLKENPFTLSPDPRYLYLSPQHREALNCLIYGIGEKKGFMVVTGGIGTGKTTLCRALLAGLDGVDGERADFQSRPLRYRAFEDDQPGVRDQDGGTGDEEAVSRRPECLSHARISPQGRTPFS